ncbi:MAG: hypothetical protein N2C12_07205 [Planctomycetales bacterium]
MECLHSTIGLLDLPNHYWPKIDGTLVYGSQDDFTDVIEEVYVKAKPVVSQKIRAALEHAGFPITSVARVPSVYA